MHNIHNPIAALFGLTLLATSSLRAADLPDPDGKPEDMSKPVKVFLIMDQSNAFGLGSITCDKPGSLEAAVKTEKLYPFLVDDAGNEVHASRYEENIVNLIKALHKESVAPNAKFVTGTIGEVTKGMTGNGGNGHCGKNSRVYVDAGLDDEPTAGK